MGVDKKFYKNVPLISFNQFATNVSGSSGSGLPHDSGFHSMAVTQNPSMAAAAQVLTFAPSSSDAIESRQDDIGVKEKYVRYEKRWVLLRHFPCKVNVAYPMRYGTIRYL